MLVTCGSFLLRLLLPLETLSDWLLLISSSLLLPSGALVVRFVPNSLWGPWELRGVLGGPILALPGPMSA